MEKLELKSLAPYLPYELKMYYNDGFEFYVETLDGLSTSEIIIGGEPVGLNEYKPILRHLSDLMTEIEANGEKFIPLVKLLRNSNFNTDSMSWDEILEYKDSLVEPLLMSFTDAQLLIEWHFDIFSLIEKNLAIDINSFEPKTN